MLTWAFLLLEVAPVKEVHTIRRLVLFAALFAAALLAVTCTPLAQAMSVERVHDVAARLGPWGPLGLALVGIFAPLILLPRWPVAVAGGLLYGIGWGSALTNTASTLGACLHFLLARSLLAPAASRLKHRYVDVARSLSARNAGAALLFLRVFPLSSSVATNLLAGTLKVRAGTFVWATFLGMLPGTLMYASWGKLIKRPSPPFYVLAAAILLTVLILTAVAHRRMGSIVSTPDKERPPQGSGES